MKLKFLPLIFLFISCFFVIDMSAAPYWGEQFSFKQPDGSMVDVLVYGDEFYQHVESLEGYPLIRNAKQWICYARLDANGEFESSDIVYSGKQQLDLKTATIFQKHIHETQAVIAKKVNLSKTLRAQTDVSLKSASGVSMVNAVEGDLFGITIIVDFPDKVANKSKQEIDNLLNQVGYEAYGNNGSVHDYYFAASNGKLNYTNFVVGYVRAPLPKSYYDDPALEGYNNVQELLTAVIDSANKIFDFSNVSVNTSNQAIALNVMYAGSPEAGWSKGLWPHAGTINKNVDGIALRKYQITSIPNTLSIGTFCHENGHSICKWPDLYDYDSDSRGVGKYCIMSSSGGTNPVLPNAFFRYLAGWETVYDISSLQVETTVDIASNTNNSVFFQNPLNGKEYYVIESKLKKDRFASLPDEGLLIWHIDTDGSNNDQQMTLSNHYYASVVQADNKSDLEHNSNGGDGNDLFKAGYRDSFCMESLPAANWWDGAFSGLSIKNISAIGDTMHFTFAPSDANKFTATPLIDGLVPGLNFLYGEGSYDNIPVLSLTNAKKIGLTSSVNLNETLRNDNYAMKFSGFVYVDTPGEYTFKLACNDGARLYLDDKLVIQNDGIHNALVTRSITLELESGYYPIKVEYFEYLNSEYLSVLWKKPNTSTFIAIEDEALFCLPTQPEPALLFDSIVGVNYSLYEGDFASPEALQAASSFETGTADQFKAADFAASGIQLNSYFYAPEDGIYSFKMESKSATVLYLLPYTLIKWNKGDVAMKQIMVGLKSGYYPLKLFMLKESDTDDFSLMVEKNGGSALSINAYRFAIQNRSRRPFRGDGHHIPGIIPAVEFDKGGVDVAYEDLSPGNLYGYFRNDDVDIDTAKYNKVHYAVSHIQFGEFLNFMVDTIEAGTYNIEISAASRNTGNYVNLYLDEKNITKLGVLKSGNDSTYVSFFRKGIKLEAASNVSMQFDLHGGGYNLAYVDFVKVGGETPTQRIEENRLVLSYNEQLKVIRLIGENHAHLGYQIYSCNGQLVQQGKSISSHSIPFASEPGVYIIQIGEGAFMQTEKLIVKGK